MTRHSDAFADVIEAWLDMAPAEEDPGSVLDRVVAKLETTRQQRRTWLAPWTVDVNPFVAVGLATAAVLVATFVGFQMLDGSDVGGPGLGNPTSSASPSPSAVPTPSFGAFDTSYRDVGFIGLPPMGSAPSDLESSELLDTYWLPGPPFMGAAYQYADGRLIWFEYTTGNEPFSSTGYLQQRLTGEGMELVQTLAGDEHPDGTRRLDFRNLSDRLPASAWVDATLRPYIPSGFAACLTHENWEDPFQDSSLTLAEKLALLPATVAGLLRDREQVPSDDYETTPCLGLTTAEARLLVAALSDAELEQDEWRNRYLLEYHVVLDSAAPDAWRLGVWFEPILPDGTIGCTSCG